MGVTACWAMALAAGALADEAEGRTLAEEIGKRIFLDPSLSEPRGQACVSCHQPGAAFADPRRVSPGAVAGREGRRNAPSLMYAALIPGRAFEDLLTPEGQEIFVWEGGLFHDGRARDLFEQVQQPFVDPVEMNLPSEAALVDRLRAASYAAAFREWVGDAIWGDPEQLAYHAYHALVEFLRAPFFRPFDARIDAYLAGEATAISESERRGLDVFRNAGGCADCHFLVPGDWPEPLLSDFGYDNLGVPSRGKRDPGLAAQTGDSDHRGQFRAPSLRNVALTAPYMHNGSIQTLREVMEFYNKRDVEPERWGATDYPETVNRDDMGDLGLTDSQIDDLVALMDAFTDRSLLQRASSGAPFPEAPASVPSTAERQLYFPGWTHRLHPAFAGGGNLSAPKVIEAKRSLDR